MAALGRYCQIISVSVDPIPARLHIQIFDCKPPELACHARVTTPIANEIVHRDGENKATITIARAKQEHLEKLGKACIVDPAAVVARHRPHKNADHNRDGGHSCPTSRLSQLVDEATQDANNRLISTRSVWFGGVKGVHNFERINVVGEGASGSKSHHAGKQNEPKPAARLRTNMRHASRPGL